MKKILLSLLIIFGLQTKAQINWCDSISYTTLPQQTLTLIGNSSLSPNMVDSITWSWQACNSTLCYSGSGDTASFVNILITDTVKVCYDAYIYFMGVNYVCTKCDSLIWDNGWILLNGNNPVSLQEVNKFEQYKIYDILGREFKNYNLIPKGTLYIKNRKKFIK
jgi:hypothetical protein